MASQHRKAVPPLGSNLSQRQLQLLALVAQLCPPSRSAPNLAQCRLIVDSRLAWAVQNIDEHSAWLYLPQPAHAERVAGCLILSAA